MMQEFLIVAGAHLLAVMSPGPDFAVVSKHSLLGSRRAGVLTALGIAIGIAVHVSYSLLGLAFIISRSILLFRAIKLLGAAYLIYLGVKALRSRKQSEAGDSEASQAQEIKRPIWTGFLTNVLNPKATLFFLALFSQVVSPDTSAVIKSLYGIEMMAATFIWFSVVSIFFSHQHIKAKIRAVAHWIDRAFGVILLGLGLKVASEEL